jgi:paraquat-inducible protein B
MNDSPRDPSEASVRTPSRFHLIWLVPIVAAGLAIYLGWKTLSSEGPLISVTFHSGQELTAGQTKVMHKAVAIGTVESVQLSAYFQQVVARVRMDQKTTALLTDHARFWVVQPNLSPTDLSGLQTLFSGQYIDMDPGTPGGNQSASSLAWSNLQSQPISLAKPSRCRDPTWAGCSQVPCLLP